MSQICLEQMYTQQTIRNAVALSSGFMPDAFVISYRAAVLTRN